MKCPPPDTTPGVRAVTAALALVPRLRWALRCLPCKCPPFPVPMPSCLKYTLGRKEGRRGGGRAEVSNIGKGNGGGVWVARLVGRPTSARVVISPPVSSSPASGSVLTARSLELLGILCLPLSVILPCPRSVSRCLSEINKR